MISSTSQISLAEYYFGFLKNLNSESKIKLISKLSQSLLEKELSASESLQSLLGAYKTNETSEEIIEKIRGSRVLNRNIETF